MAGNFTSSRLREAVLEHLVRKFEDPASELTSQDVNAATAYLKAFPPEDPLPTALRQSPQLEAYGKKMKYA